MVPCSRRSPIASSQTQKSAYATGRSALPPNNGHRQPDLSGSKAPISRRQKVVARGPQAMGALLVSHPPEETLDRLQGINSRNTFASFDVRTPRIWQNREPLHNRLRPLGWKHAHNLDVDRELLHAAIITGTEMPTIVSASNTNCASLSCRHPNQPIATGIRRVI